MHSQVAGVGDTRGFELYEGATKALSRWIQQHAFQIAVVIAVAAVLLSYAATYRAINDLPEIQRRIASLEEQLGRLNSLHAAVGAAVGRANVVALRGSIEDRTTLAAAVSRGEQLIDELSKHESVESVSSLVDQCRDYLIQLHDQAPMRESDSGMDHQQLHERGSSLGPLLRQEIEAGRESLNELRQSAVDQRRVARTRLLAGHGTMIAMIGLLYFARATERRRRELADQKLLESDERFALVIQGSADGIILADAGGKILMTNPALRTIFGKNEDELTGQPLTTLFETTAIDEWLTHRIDDPYRLRTPRDVIGKRGNGERFSAELTLTKQSIRNQEFFAISVRDVSERETSRLRLRQHEALLREVPEPLHILDGVGRIIYWNVGAERLFGYGSDEAIGKSASDLLGIIPPSGDNQNIHARNYVEADRWAGQLKAVTKSGRSLRIERRRTRIIEGDKVVGEVIFDLDLGERKRLQNVERRRQRLEALGMLASGIAHDLNNLLTPILMSSRMLQKGGEKIDRGAMLDTIVAGASRGAELIAQLLTFARGGEGQHAPVDLTEIIDEVIGILAHTLPKDISLEASLDPTLPQVNGDATEISQVIMNLAINARDSMPDGGRLMITAKPHSLEAERTFSFATLQPGPYVAISVSDTGFGIPQSIRDRIFDPFFSTKERGQGTGLGLSTSLGIVRSHGGAVDVSSAVGKGTTVTFHLPSARSPNDSEKAK